MNAASRNHLKMAVRSLRAAKGRSLLTILGVVIGIMAVVVSVGIGEGVKAQVAGQAGKFGKDLLAVRPGGTSAQPKQNALFSTDLLFGQTATGGFTPRDVDAVRRAGHVGAAAPLGIVPGQVAAAGDKTAGQTLVIATGPSLPQLLNQQVQYGDFFDPDNPDDHVAVLGSRVPAQLFDEDVPLGQTLTFRGQSFIVRGILHPFASSPLSAAADFNNAIFIPYQVAEGMTGGETQFYTILAKPDTPKNAPAARQAIQASLTRQHGGQQDFSVLNQAQMLAAGGNVLDLLTMLVDGMALIALLVGGVGIMNIMLVAVTERMHEVGVRKAVGATNRQIMNQFLLEAVVLSVSGGVTGVVLSIAADLLLRAYTSFQPVISWNAIGLATLVTVGVGVVFGTAPAVKAARKDPIEALRHE